MISLGLGGGWAAMVVLVLARYRPPPTRARALLATSRVSHFPSARSRPNVVVTFGNLVLDRLPGARVIAGGPNAPTTAPRGAGIGAIVAIALLGLVPPLAPVAFVAGLAVPRHLDRRQGRRRLRQLEVGLPDIVDLLVLAVGAGCNVPLALAAAGRRGSGPLAQEIQGVMDDVGRGRRLADALDDLPRRAGEPVRPLAGVLAGCERYGSPVLPALQRLADEVRLQRQRRAEVVARRIPVTLLFPLVLCILPAFALLTVAPLIAGTLRELRL